MKLSNYCSTFGLIFSLLAIQPVKAFTPALLFDPELAAKQDPAFDLATYNKLRTIIINVHWDKADLKTALAELAAKSVSAGENIHFSISVSGADPRIAKKVPMSVSLIIVGTPMWDVLEYFTNQTNLIPLIHKNSVIMVPQHETRDSFGPSTTQPPNVR